MATQKQKRAARIKLENPQMPMGKVMIQAGYKETSATVPSDLTNSKGWIELMEDFLPDKYLAQKHKEFLDSPRVVTTYQRGEITSQVEETSPQAVKALDMAYKIKNKYKDVNINGGNFVFLSGQALSKYGIDPGTGNNPK